MHCRRSIIKKRDDDEVTLTRPLNKRVSFSVSNQTRVFTVDSDESKQTTFGGDSSSIGLGTSTLYHQQSLLNGTSLMEQESLHHRSPSKGPHGTNSSLDGLFNASGFMEMSISSGPSEDLNKDDGWLEDYAMNVTEHTDDQVDGDQTREAATKDGDKAASNDNVILTKPNDERRSKATNEPSESEKGPPAERVCRTSLDQEDKTRPVELCEEKTGPVREELRRVAEGLLPPETKPDIYGIKAALQGRAERKRQNVNNEPVHEYTFANNTITGIRFSNIMPDLTMVLSDEPSRCSPGSDSNSILDSNTEADHSHRGSIRQSSPSHNLLDESAEKNLSANDACTVSNTEPLNRSLVCPPHSADSDNPSKLGDFTHRSRCSSTATQHHATYGSLMPESAITTSMSARDESVLFNCTEIETLNSTDITENDDCAEDEFEEGEHMTTTHVDYDNQGENASGINLSNGSLTALMSATASSNWEEADVTEGSSRAEDTDMTQVDEPTSPTTINDDEWIEGNEYQNEDEMLPSVIGKDNGGETNARRQSFVPGRTEKGKKGRANTGDNDGGNDGDADDSQDHTLSQPGPDRQLDMSGVQALDDTEAQPTECDQTNESNNAETTFTKSRLSRRLSEAAAEKGRPSKICDRSRLSQTTDVSSIANKTYSINRPAQKSVPPEDETSLLHDEPEVSALHDYTHISEVSSHNLLCQSGAQLGTPQETHLQKPFRPASIRKGLPATKQDIIDEHLFAEFPELFEGLTTFTQNKVIPPIPAPPKLHIKYGIDRAALEKTLVPEKDEEYDKSLGTQLDELDSTRDSFKALLSRVNRFLTFTTPWPFIDKAHLEEVAPHQDIYVECDFETRAASVSYSKHTLPLVKINCCEGQGGCINGTIIDCTETDPEYNTGGLFALAPLMVTWAQRALVRNCEGLTWTASSWTNAEMKIRSAVEILEANWAPFKGVEFWLRTDMAGKQKVSFGGIIWRCHQVAVHIDADLQEQLEVCRLDENCDYNNFELKMDELHEVWKGDGVLSFRERINNVHRRTLEAAADRTIEEFQVKQLEKSSCRHF